MADPYSMTYNPVSEEDIFDLYGSEYLLSKVQDADSRSILESRVKEIHKVYLAAAKKRAEWVLESCGVAHVTSDSLRSAVGTISSNFEKNLVKKLDSQPFGGNLLGAIIEAQQESGADLGDLDIEKYGVEHKKVKAVRDFSNIGLGEWKEIAEAYFNLEDADTVNEMILAIDHLNDLQHCGGNLLVDFQMGRRVGEGKAAKHVTDEHVQKAVDNMNKILDIKRDSASPVEFLPQMSSTVRKVWQENRKLLED